MSEAKCGPVCKRRVALDDLIRALQGQESLILLVNLKIEVALKMLNLSQGDNHWNMSCSERQEQP